MKRAIKEDVIFEMNTMKIIEQNASHMITHGKAITKKDIKDLLQIIAKSKKITNNLTKKI